MNIQQLLGALLEADEPVSIERLLDEASVHLPRRGKKWMASFYDANGDHVWQPTGETDRSAAKAIAKSAEQTQFDRETALHKRGHNLLTAPKGLVLQIAASLFLARRRQAPSPESASPGVIQHHTDPAAGKLLPAIALAPRRVAQLIGPEPPFTFIQWRDAFAQYFPLLVRPAQVCLGVISQLLLNDVANPFALALVDVPSSGKTIILNCFDVPELIYTTDNFTPVAFVSHASNIKRQELAQVDLLPRIRYRTLIARDLAPLFGAREDDVMKSLGILTRALDGEGLETDSGVHGQRGYKGDYLTCGSTPRDPMANGCVRATPSPAAHPGASRGANTSGRS